MIKCLVNLNKDLLDTYKYTYIISNITLIILTAVSSIAILYFKNISIFFIILYLWVIRIRENSVYNKKMKLYATMYGDNKQ